ncbi:hypothetical protein IEQ34_005936 [Dendrobium chrysotoxum]|uniref:Uncharacterized protein n=1 Tax=Dendrobium chrysotoxum TaxID=161865 RepID=A0AAV7HE22_DENCH|nr:hypothetical protein IEQ34_005936 [Dendrobium chrysotoxum]
MKLEQGNKTMMLYEVEFITPAITKLIENDLTILAFRHDLSRKILGDDKTRRDGNERNNRFSYNRK